MDLPEDLTISTSAYYLLSVAILGVSFLIGRFVWKRTLSDAIGVSRIRFSLSDWFLFLGLVVGVVYFSSLIGGAINHFAGKDASNAVIVFLPTIIMQMMMLGAMAVLQKYSTSKFYINFSLNKEILQSGVKYFFVCYTAMLLFGAFVALGSVYFFNKLPEPQEAVDILKNSTDFVSRFLGALSVILLAPIVEEVVFRGILYRALKGFFKTGILGVVVAAVISSAIFSLIHFSAMAFLPLFFIGLILVASYEKNGSILAPIVAHTLFNALNSILLLLQ